MRAPLLALLSLLVAASPALAARNTDRSPGGAQRAKVTATAPAAAKPATRNTTARPAARQAGKSVARPTRQRATSSIRSRETVSRDRRAAIASSPATSCPRGARRCSTRHMATPPMRWSQGLSPAAGVQAATCPAGTMATLATGHSDVVRCMPI